MKSIRQALVVFVALHLLALVAFVAWLGLSGRISGDRLRAVVDSFRLTIEEEVAQAEADDAAAAEAEKMAMDAARMQLVATGPATLSDQIEVERQSDEITRQKLARLHREIRDLQNQLALAQDTVAKQQTKLDAERKTFQDEVARLTKQRGDENFLQAVSMYEQLKPKQAKLMFQDLIAGGKQDEVVDYLAAMQLRKAAAVLKEFKTDEEAAEAAKLIEQLRLRGLTELDDGASASPAGGPTLNRIGGAT